MADNTTVKELAIAIVLFFCVKLVTEFKSPVHTYTYKMVKYDMSRLASNSIR